LCEIAISHHPARALCLGVDLQGSAGHEWAKTREHTRTLAGRTERNVLMNKTAEHVLAHRGLT
jgi:hypothetical protein